MPTTQIRGSLTRTLDDPRSPVRLFIEERFPDIRAVQRRYRDDAPDQIVPGNDANAGTVGTACDWLLRFLVHPQPDVHVALMGGAYVPRDGLGLDVALFEMCETLGIPTGEVMPPKESATTFVGPGPGSALEPGLLARACWALALLSEFYRAGPAVAAEGPLGHLDPARPLDLLALASPAAIDQLTRLRSVLEEQLLPRLVTRRGTWALGPTFTGSSLLHADADLIAAGLLLELKTAQGRARSDGSRRAGLEKVDLFQLVGYALLDFDDEHQITELGLFAARFGYFAAWHLADLLGEMAGHEVDLPATRDAFWQLLTPRATVRHTRPAP